MKTCSAGFRCGNYFLSETILGFTVMLKSTLNGITRLPLRFLLLLDEIATHLRPSWRGRIRGNAIDSLLAIHDEIVHKDVHLKVLSPNALCSYRVKTFSSKEPETLEWIDGFQNADVIWDIGANIGLYSIYVAKRHPSAKVYAFEPSVLNLELLAKNIGLNNLTGSICIVPVPLFRQRGEDSFRLQTADRGGALSAFSVNYNQDNEPLKVSMLYRTLGLSLDDLVTFFGLEQPDHIKIDVDGVEHLILSGGKKVLTNPRLKSVLVELNDSFLEQKKMAEEILQEAGLVLLEKRRAEAMFDAAASQIWNNIWVRR